MKRIYGSRCSHGSFFRTPRRFLYPAAGAWAVAVWCGVLIAAPPSPPHDLAPTVETSSPTHLGITGLTANGRIHPQGLPTTYHFEYGPTEPCAYKTVEQSLPPQLAAHYRETWDTGWNGWMSWDSRMQHFKEGGASGGYIRYHSIERDDHNHDDGIGTVHLAKYLYPGPFAPVPSVYLAAGDPDFRDAVVRIAVRGNQWRPNGTELMWWSQSQSNVEVNPDSATLGPGWIHANWCYTGQNLTDRLFSGQWERCEYRLTNDSNAWSYCGNAPGRAGYQYWQIDETQRHLNIDFFHMVVFVDPNRRPTGSIDFDEFEVTYRNYSLLFPGNGGRLVSAPAGSNDDPAALTDGWRHGDGKMWRSAIGPPGPLEFEYALANPVTVRAVQIHQHPDWPSKEVEILVSADGRAWRSVARGELPKTHTAGPNFAFLLERGLNAQARHVKVRILSGYCADAWGLGEIEMFGDGAVCQTDQDWYHVNRDITGLQPGQTYHLRLVATNAAGTAKGKDETFTVPSDPKPHVLTGPASRIRSDAAKVEGRLNPLGKKTNFYFEYGLDRSYGQRTSPQYGGMQITPRIAIATLTGLKPAATYHYRLVGTNEAGTSYGADATFTSRAETE
ncbi:MAG: discoidin domain-containing protein [Pirellulales bacterium]|nr:discoidin domain-containing protein [Pirellulales bacterium]